MKYIQYSKLLLHQVKVFIHPIPDNLKNGKAPGIDGIATEFLQIPRGTMLNEKAICQTRHSVSLCINYQHLDLTAK